MAHDFRKPVFVRNDDQSHVEVSAVVWNEQPEAGISIKFTNGNGESVLVDSADWQRIKAAVDAELNRLV